MCSFLPPEMMHPELLSGFSGLKPQAQAAIGCLIIINQQQEIGNPT